MPTIAQSLTTHAVRAAIRAFIGSVAARLGRVLIKLVGLTGVRSPPNSGAKADIPGLRIWADFVEEVREQIGVHRAVRRMT